MRADELPDHSSPPPTELRTVVDFGAKSARKYFEKYLAEDSSHINTYEQFCHSFTETSLFMFKVLLKSQHLPFVDIGEIFSIFEKPLPGQPGNQMHGQIAKLLDEAWRSAQRQDTSVRMPNLITSAGEIFEAIARKYFLHQATARPLSGADISGHTNAEAMRMLLH